MGVMISCAGELNFSWVGFTLQIIAMFADCGNKVLMDVLLKDLVLDSMSMLYYTAPISCVVIYLGFVAFELDRFQMEFLSSPTFLMALVANGLLAVCLNLSVMLLVGKTSSMVIGMENNNSIYTIYAIYILYMLYVYYICYICILYMLYVYYIC